jgi:hypothetical protein
VYGRAPHQPLIQPPREESPVSDESAANANAGPRSALKRLEEEATPRPTISRSCSTSPTWTEISTSTSMVTARSSRSWALTSRCSSGATVRCSRPSRSSLGWRC